MFKRALVLACTSTLGADAEAYDLKLVMLWLCRHRRRMGSHGHVVGLV
jgi:hypothetical protein